MTFSVDQLVGDCVEATENTAGHSGAAIEQILARVISNPSAIENSLGHPKDMPVFSTWHNSEDLTILHVVWPPKVDLIPHDHMMWASIGLYGGREDNKLFRSLPDGGLEHRSSKIMRTGDTILLGKDTVHAVANPSKEWTGAIHIYGGDFFRDGRRQWPSEAGPDEAFDIDLLYSTLNNAAELALKS